MSQDSGARCGRLLLMGSLFILLGLPDIHGADFLKNRLACKLAGLPSNCNEPETLTVVTANVPSSPIPSAPGPGVPSPLSPQFGPVSPPGPTPVPPSPGAGPPSPQPPNPAADNSPGPGPSQLAPAAPVPAPYNTPDLAPVPQQMSDAPAPVPSDLAPVPEPMSDTPAPVPSAPAPAPVPMPDTPAPAPDTPLPKFVIAAGGPSGQAQSSSIYTISTGRWTTGPDLAGSYGRTDFPMIPLSSTEALAAGGDGQGYPSAEIYSTLTQTWQFTERMQEFRYKNSMIQLPDGSAFTAGGITYGGPGFECLDTTELYNKGAWEPGPTMDIGRASSTMLTYVADATTWALVCGGVTGSGSSEPTVPVATCERLSLAGTPSSNFFQTAASLSTAVSNHRAVVLKGSPFITGGLDSSEKAIKTTQLLVNGVWQSQVGMRTARAGHEMVVLQDNSVLVCGGFGVDNPEIPLDSCERFDGTLWSPSPSLPSGQENFKMLVLPNGDVLYYGMAPQSAKWTPGAEAWVTVTGDPNVDGRSQFGLAAVGI